MRGAIPPVPRAPAWCAGRQTFHSHLNFRATCPQTFHSHLNFRATCPQLSFINLSAVILDTDTNCDALHHATVAGLLSLCPSVKTWDEKRKVLHQAEQLTH